MAVWIAVWIAIWVAWPGAVDGEEEEVDGQGEPEGVRDVGEEEASVEEGADTGGEDDGSVEAGAVWVRGGRNAAEQVIAEGVGAEQESQREEGEW